MATHEHKKHAPKTVGVGVITVSTSRSKNEDQSGAWICDQIRERSQKLLYYDLIPDDRKKISETVFSAINDYSPDIIVITGGTGIGPQDVTIEAVVPMFDKEITAFSNLFTQLSYTEIGAACILSRATAGVIGQTIVFCIPGSLNACKLACNDIIFNEMGHLVRHIRE